MISPYVRRLRLGMELRSLRVDRNLNQDVLARRIGKSRMEISRLETGQSVDLADVLNILDALGIEGELWTKMVSIAREACERGWWDSIKRIGDRQALYANLEAGAESIWWYEQTFLPGLFQIPEYVQARIDASATLEPVSGNLEGILAGRAGRHRNLRRPGGPSVEVIIDEAAIWRLAVPPQVQKKQIRHLAQVIESEQPGVSIRVLKLSAMIQDFTVPRSTFSVYRYPDPGDPTVVAIDTVTSDVIVTDDAQVTPYEKLYERLRDAALPPAKTADFLLKAACEIPEYF
jgi:transcriptional regulator with XRE-family HTH domain